MKQNFKGPIALAVLALLILTVFLAAGCEDLVNMFSEEEETTHSWVEDLPPLEQGSHRVYFLTSHITGLAAANPSYKDVRPPDNKVDALAVQPSRSGYTFIGWYNNPAETGGTRFTVDTVVTGDWKLYGRWFYGTPTTVTFNGNNGTPGTQTRTVTPPDTTVLDWPEDPTPPGANPFSGWYTESNGGVLFTSSTTVPYSTTITVYAQYGDKYTVTFDKNGGETDANPATMSVFGSGTTLSALPAQPTLTDKVFAGWFDTSESAGGNPFTTATGITGDITVYARWNDPPPSTVTFNYQGGSGTENSRSVPYKAAIGTLPTPSATPRANLSFAGWYTAPNKGGEKYTAETVVTANVTLHARWKGLMLYYKFVKQGNYQVKDETGDGNHATFMADTTQVNANNSSTNPRYGTATKNSKTINYYHQNASSSAKPHMSLPSGVGTIIGNLDEEFTISVIVTPYSGSARTAAAFMNGANLNSATTGGLYLSSTSSSIGYVITGTNSAAAQKVMSTVSDTGGTVAYHICYTQVGKTGPNNGKLYINGNLVSQGTITLLPADVGATANNYLARPFDNGSDYLGWPAKLAEFMIYNRALTQEEITVLAADKDVLN